MNQVLSTSAGILFGGLDDVCVDFTGVTAGDYTFTYTQDSGDGCSQNANVIVTVTESPNLQLVNDGQTIQLCQFDNDLTSYEICGNTVDSSGATYPSISYNIGTVDGSGNCVSFTTNNASTGTGSCGFPNQSIYTLNGTNGITPNLTTEQTIEYCVTAVSNDGCEDTSTFTLQVMPDIQTGECMGASYCQGYSNTINPATDWLINYTPVSAITSTTSTYQIDIAFVSSSDSSVTGIPYSGGNLSIGTTQAIDLSTFTMVDLSSIPENTTLCFDFMFNYQFAGQTDACTKTVQCCIEILTSASAGTSTAITVCN